MNDQLQGVLADLAKQLGTSIKELYASLICQARIEVITDICIYALFCTSFTVALLMYRKRDTECFDDDYAYFWIFWASVILTGVFLIIALANTPDMLTAAFNPRYFAFKEISNLIKPKS